MPIQSLKARAPEPDPLDEGGRTLVVAPVDPPDATEPRVRCVVGDAEIAKGTVLRWGGAASGKVVGRAAPTSTTVVTGCRVTDGVLDGRARWSDGDAGRTVVGYARVLPVRGARKTRGGSRWKTCTVRFLSGAHSVPSARADGEWRAEVASVPLPGLAVLGLDDGETFEHDPAMRRTREAFLEDALRRYGDDETVVPYWDVPMITRALFFEGLSLPPGEMSACGAMARRCGTRTPTEGFVPFAVLVSRSDDGTVGVDDLVPLGDDDPVPFSALMAARATAPRAAYDTTSAVRRDPATVGSAARAPSPERPERPTGGPNGIVTAPPRRPPPRRPTATFGESRERPAGPTP